jgi:hypothetical protein
MTNFPNKIQLAVLSKNLDTTAKFSQMIESSSFKNFYFHDNGKKTLMTKTQLNSLKKRGYFIHEGKIFGFACVPCKPLKRNVVQVIWY